MRRTATGAAVAGLLLLVGTACGNAAPRERLREPGHAHSPSGRRADPRRHHQQRHQPRRRLRVHRTAGRGQGLLRPARRPGRHRRAAGRGAAVRRRRQRRRRQHVRAPADRRGQGRRPRRHHRARLRGRPPGVPRARARHRRPAHRPRVRHLSASLRDLRQPRAARRYARLGRHPVRRHRGLPLLQARPGRPHGRRRLLQPVRVRRLRQAGHPGAQGRGLPGRHRAGRLRAARLPGRGGRPEGPGRRPRLRRPRHPRQRPALQGHGRCRRPRHRQGHQRPELDVHRARGLQGRAALPQRAVGHGVQPQLRGHRRRRRTGVPRRHRGAEVPFPVATGGMGGRTVVHGRGEVLRPGGDHARVRRRVHGPGQALLGRMGC